MAVTQKRLKELITYEPTTGLFYWNNTGKGRRLDRQAGTINKSTGYVFICIDGVLDYAHRLAYIYMGVEVPNQVDHDNRIRHDNRWCNLKASDNQKNKFNLTKRISNTSGVTGVYWNKLNKNYRARIQKNGKKIELGSFNNIQDAAQARQKAIAALGFNLNHGN